MIICVEAIFRSLLRCPVAAAAAVVVVAAVAAVVVVAAVAVVGVVVVAVVDAWFDMDVDHHHITEL